MLAQRPGTYRYYASKIRALPDFGAPSAARGEVPIPNTLKTSTELRGPAFYCVKSEGYKFDTNLRDYIIFNPNSDVIFPGALVRTKSVTNGSPSLVNGPRTPIDIWLNIANSRADAKGVIPTSLEVTKAINRIAYERNNNAISPASLVYDYKEFYSLEQSLFQLGLKASFTGGDVTAQITSRSSSAHNAVIAKFIQVYFTATYSVPQLGNQYIFAKKMKEYQSDDIFQTNNPLSYISEVKYGRMMIFKVESKNSTSDITAALNASKQFVGGQIDLNAALAKFNSLSELKITVLISGGSHEEAIKVIGSNDFLAFIKANPIASPTSPAIPVGFVVKDLKNNALVESKEATDFVKSSLQPVQKSVRIFLEKVKVHNDGDGVLEGAGDFYWGFDFNGQSISARGRDNQLVVGTGGEFTLNESKTLTLDYRVDTEIKLTGRICDADGGVSGNDDCRDFGHSIRLESLVQLGGRQSFNIRQGQGDDPDLEVIGIVIEVLGDVNCQN